MSLSITSIGNSDWEEFNKQDCEWFVNRLNPCDMWINYCPLLGHIVGFWFSVCTITLEAGRKQHASLFLTCGPGLLKKKKKWKLLYFKTELKLLGPICSWIHSENIALCFAGTESGPFALMWLGSDERQTKNGTLSPWVSSHPTSFPLSSVFSCTFTHISSQVNLRHFAGEMKELGKHAQSKRFLLSPKQFCPVSDRKAPHQELFFSISYLQKWYKN